MSAESAPTTAADTRPVVVSFRNVTKTYDILQRATPRMGAWVVNKLFEYLRREPFDALRDATFEVRRGEMLGLIGANGAGKSTILKLTAGIGIPTSGSVRVAGRVASMLELGVGFHPELTGLENIFYNGAVMGLTRGQVLERLERIVAFSGLERFLYEPVKHYSSGMYARLACSVALHTDPDIVLADEILAVGDAEFQQRGMARLLELHEAGTTIILVSHAMATVRDMCDRLVWVDGGRIRMDGPPAEVAHAYSIEVARHAILPRHFLSTSQVVLSTASAADLDAHGMAEWNDRPVPRITAARAETPDRVAVESIETNAPLRLRLEIDERGTTRPYRAALCVRWSDGRVIFEDISPPVRPGTNDGPLVYDVPACRLLRASIRISFALLDAEDPSIVLDRSVDAVAFEITSSPLVFTPFIAIQPEASWSLRSVET